MQAALALFCSCDAIVWATGLRTQLLPQLRLLQRAKVALKAAESLPPSLIILLQVRALRALRGIGWASASRQYLRGWAPACHRPGGKRHGGGGAGAVGAAVSEAAQELPGHAAAG